MRASLPAKRQRSDRSTRDLKCRSTSRHGRRLLLPAPDSKRPRAFTTPAAAKERFTIAGLTCRICMHRTRSLAGGSTAARGVTIDFMRSKAHSAARPKTPRCECDHRTDRAARSDDTPRLGPDHNVGHRGRQVASVPLDGRAHVRLLITGPVPVRVCAGRLPAGRAASLIEIRA